MFYRIVDVNPLPNMCLLVRFTDNIVKEYDIRPLIKTLPAFQALGTPDLFKQVRVDIGGYGVVWNDELDISSNELWEKGKLVQ